MEDFLWRSNEPSGNGDCCILGKDSFEMYMDDVRGLLRFDVKHNCFHPKQIRQEF